MGSTATYYTYIGSQITSETTGGNTMYFHYDANGSPVGMRYNGALYFYAKNIQGDIIGIVNEAGSMVVEYTYDAWGNPLSTTGTAASTIGAANPLRYRGYYYDEETGLYYLQSRYYNPVWGRFINADSYAQTSATSVGANMYAYCGNNPVMFSDPTGHYVWTIPLVMEAAKAIVGGLGALYVGALGYAAVDYFANSPAYERDDADSAPVVVPKPTQSAPTYIYRYSTDSKPKPRSLVPSNKDKANNSPLSFSTKYRANSYRTTIEEINSTKILWAVQDSPTHISVYPLNGTISEWRNQGTSSIWTQTLLRICDTV